MSEKEKRILEKLALLKEDQVIPSTIGHILRDKYQVKIKNLTKVLNLNQTKSQMEALRLKVQNIKLHLKNNKKDIPCSRRLKQLESKLYHYKIKLNESNK